MQYSAPDHNSANQAFFMQNPSDDPSIAKNQLTKDKIDEYTKRYMVSKELSDGKTIPIFPESLKTFFVDKPYTCEIYIKNWTIMSLQNMIERFESVSADGILALDIAFRYSGMGHINVLFYDPINQCYFIRWDGGSNGYDRKDNYNKLKQYKYDGDMSYQMTFDQILQVMERKIEEPECLKL